ncbi:ribonuclease HI [Sulfurospirillum sp. 1612]|uniref:ribonuclease HI n=1 Tax=Sulfurospirillum sp. 1612 TaxID=3094835 RepID=UPI002F9275F9
MKKIYLFSDGSSLGNPGAGGYCAILRFKDHEKIIKGGEKVATNNQMELKAVIEGLKALKSPCDVEITSDSTYVVKGINEWLENWKKKHFVKIKNPELWKEYVKVSQPHKIQAKWVRGHDGHEENERCDQIAKEEAEKLR